MNIPQTIRDRNEQRLAGVHPALAQKIRTILAGMEAIGFPMLVTQGLRTAEYQHALYLQGRETPGPNVRPGKPLGDTVTNADGFKARSNHQAAADGFGHAVDCAFIIDGVDKDGEYETAAWDTDLPWALYGAACEAHDLTWGGRWKRVDGPHAELK